MRSSYITTLVTTAIGCLIYAVGLDMFYIPHQFMAGGITGIAMIVYYLTGFPVGTLNLLLNVPLLFLALRYLGKFYTVVTILGTIMMSIFIDAFSFTSSYGIIKDPILATITGGFLMGVGSGFIYRYNGNGGGFDILAALMKKYYNIEMGTFIFVTNCVIVAAGAGIFTLELGVCTLVGMYITANVTNRVVIGINQRKAAFIVSDKPREISDMIIRYLGRSATMLHGQGAFTGIEKEVLLSIVNLTQIARLKQLIKELDPNAFLFIMNTTDVIGKGFTMPVMTSSSPTPSGRYVQGKDGHLTLTDEWMKKIEEEEGVCPPAGNRPEKNTKEEPPQ